MTTSNRNGNVHKMLTRLENLGMTWEDAANLRRIAMTLGNWSEKECGVDAGHIERDETTNLPYWHPAGYHSASTGKYIEPKPYRINDLEAGALRRLSALSVKYSDLIFYHQTDPRGAAIYVLRASDLPDTDPSTIDQLYPRGVAVWKGY